MPTHTACGLNLEHEYLIQRKVVSELRKIRSERNEILPVVQKVSGNGAATDINAGFPDLLFFTVIQIPRRQNNSSVVR
jgi:hypothetical protein